MPSDSDAIWKYMVSTACGMVFGIAIEKGRVHEPQFIRGQMDFSYFVMMKMFLGAVASGMAGMCLISMGPDSIRIRLHDARASFISCLSNKGFVSSVIGGGLLGAGMTISGACPGMVLVQVGTQTHNALYTLGGGLLGAVLYGLLEPAVVQLTKPTGIAKHERLDDSGRYTTTALPLAALFGCAVAAIEMYHPWTSDVSPSWGGTMWTTKAWPAYIAGAVIGLIQIPLVLVLRDTLSGSGSYCTVVSQVLITNRLRRALPYLAKFRSGVCSWWQVFYAGGAVLGGYLSAQASGNLGLSSPVTQYHALLGGGLMVFGSRLAGGCTSGHGLSGMSLLMLDSFVTVASMFAGAMGTYSALKQGII